jgi:hypothetical protein
MAVFPTIWNQEVTRKSNKRKPIYLNLANRETTRFENHYDGIPPLFWGGDSDNDMADSGRIPNLSNDSTFEPTVLRKSFRDIERTPRSNSSLHRSGGGEFLAGQNKSMLNAQKALFLSARAQVDEGDISFQSFSPVSTNMLTTLILQWPAGGTVTLSDRDQFPDIRNK